MFSPENFALTDVKVAADRKHDRNGKAKILDPSELSKLFEAFNCDRDRLVFGLCYFTGSRITEVLSLHCEDVGDDSVMFKADRTKTGDSRTAQIIKPLRALLDAYLVEESGALFPGRHGRGQMTRQAADLILREACKDVGLEGVSTHSFRRSFVTALAKEGRTPSQIRQLTGHKSLGSLLEYFGA
jgi:integrase/recombinase XerD